MGNEQSSSDDGYNYNEERFERMIKKYVDPNFVYYENSNFDERLNNYMVATIALSVEEYEKKNLACCLKFKAKFMKWLWKARENIAIRRFHPSKITTLLEKGVEIEDLDLYL